MSEEMDKKVKALDDIRAMSAKRLALWRDVCAAQNAKMLKEWLNKMQTGQNTNKEKNS